jgi:hypothetical protein
MMDPVVCERLPQESKPRIALHVLIRLLDSMKTRTLPDRPSVALSDLSPSTKGQHVSEKDISQSTGAIASAQEHALAPTARTDSSAVSSVIDPTHPANGADDHARKERR